MEEDILRLEETDHNRDAMEFLELVRDPNSTLSEDFLIGLNKGFLENAIFGSSASSYQQIWNALMSTASCLDVTNSHLTRACSAICGFLSSASTSASGEFLELGRAENTWIAAFNIYLRRYGDTKSKVTSQLLSTLVDILSKNQDTSTADSVRSSSAISVLSVIFSLGPAALLKPSLIALELFLRKNVLSIDQILVLIHAKLDIQVGDQNILPSPIEEFSWYHRDLISITVQKHSQNPSFDLIPTCTFKRLFSAVLVNCFRAETILAAAKLLATVLNLSETCALKLGNSELICQYWVELLKAALATQPDALQDFKTYVFPALFQNHPLRFVAFLNESFPTSTPSETSNLLEEFDVKYLLFTLEIGKELGMVREIETGFSAISPVMVQESEVLLRQDFLYRYLYQLSPMIRLSAFSLIVTSSQTNAPLTPGNLAELRDCLFYSHADPDREVRSKILSLERKLIIRLRGAVSVLDKDHSLCYNQANPNGRGDIEDQKGLLDAHVSFLKWYIAILIDDLGPSATYQKHICALKALHTLLQTGLDRSTPPAYFSKVGQDQLSWVIHIPIFCKSLFRNLFDLLSNPFEDVRSRALDILKTSPISHTRTQGVYNVLLFEDVRNAMSRAKVLASRTGRADHADTVARLHDLVFHLTVKLFDEGTDLTLIREHPFDVVASTLTRLEQDLDWVDSKQSSRAYYLHGFLSAIRYIISYPNFHVAVRALVRSNHSNWRYTHDICMKICSKVWNDVREVLCIDSPEGQVDEEVDYDMGVGPKDLLSASWRALREASLLLDAMLSNLTYAPSEGAFQLTHQDFESIGTLCFTQLAELRHRGAFSTVSQTFAACCRRCESSTISSIHELPNRWLENALVIIDEQACKLTRRSAGIPAIISGIISANPSGPLFHHAMGRLTELAELPPPEIKIEDDVRLPQVHAMNCLKDIVTNTKLGPSTEPFIPALVKICVRCVESQRWAIRNCGLMLLRALISRMCQSSHLSSSTGNTEDSPNHLAKISFDKFPQLCSIILKLLDTEHQETTDHTSTPVQGPLVEVLATQKTFIALELIRRRSSSIDIEARLLKLVFQFTSSRNWSIREQAAKAYSSQVSRGEQMLVANVLLSRKWCSTNALHGALLTASYIVQNMISTSNTPGIPLPTVNVKNPSPTQVVDKFISILQTADIHKQEILDQNCPYTAEVFWAIVCDLLEYLIKISDQYKYLPTLKRVDEFEPGEDLTSKFKFPGKKTLFLGFSKPGAAIPPSHAGSSYLRFLCLWFVIDVSEEAHKSPSTSNGCDALNEALDARDIDALKVFSGLEEVFSSSDWMSRNRLALYGLFTWEKRNEETKTVALRNIAQVYLRYSLHRERLRSMLPDTSTVDYNAADLLHSLSNSYESREMSDAKLSVEGARWAIHWGKFEPIEDMEENIKEYVGHDTQPWIRKLRLAGNDQNEFSTRLAAIRSIEGFQYTLRPGRQNPRSSELFLDLYLVLYDILNDDDDEIRSHGARVTSWILGGSEADVDAFHNGKMCMSLLPMAASLRLSEFFAKDYADSRALFCEAVGRITGHRETINSYSPPATLRPVKILLREYMQENTDLFAEEKQNLFVDDAREIAVWSDILAKLGAELVPNRVLRDLMHWTIEGLNCLTLTATSEGVDGPFGWASNPEVFVLGLRVIYSSKVLLEWSEKDEMDALKIDTLPLYTRLSLLLEKGEELQLPDRWLETVRSIPKDSATHGLVAR